MRPKLDENSVPITIYRTQLKKLVSSILLPSLLVCTGIWIKWRVDYPDLSYTYSQLSELPTVKKYLYGRAGTTRARPARFIVVLVRQLPIAMLLRRVASALKNFKKQQSRLI